MMGFGLTEILILVFVFGGLAVAGVVVVIALFGRNKKGGA